MALTLTAGSPVPTQTTAAALPLKAPPAVIANEICTWSATGLPEGLFVEEGPSLSCRILGTPTKIETKAAVKIKAENLAKTESKETAASEWKVVEPEFNSVGLISLEVEEVDKPTGELIDAKMKSGTPYKTANQAELTVLTSASVAGIVERLN